MFTDYKSVVYEVLSFTEAKTASQICKEVDDSWATSGKKSFFGGRKKSRVAGVFFALIDLEEEGFAVTEFLDPTNSEEEEMKWSKKRGGRKVRKKQFQLSLKLRPRSAVA